jgi:hypothetical protein
MNRTAPTSSAQSRQAKCRKIGDVDGGWRSVYNASRKFARLWEFTHGRPYRFFGITKVVTQCGGGDRDTDRNNLCRPAHSQTGALVPRR